MASYIRKPGILIINHPDPPNYCNIGQAAPVGLEVDIDGESTLFLAAPGGNPNKKCYIWKITADEVDGPYLVLEKDEGTKYNCPAIYWDGTYIHVIYSAAGVYQTEYHAKALPSDLNNWTVNEIPKPEAGAFHYGSVFYMPSRNQVAIISNIDDPPYEGDPYTLTRIFHMTLYDVDCTAIQAHHKLMDYTLNISERTDYDIVGGRVYSKRLLYIETPNFDHPVFVGGYRIRLNTSAQFLFPYMGAYIIDLENSNPKIYTIYGDFVSDSEVDAVTAEALELLPADWDYGYTNFIGNLDPTANRYYLVGGTYRDAQDYVFIFDFSARNTRIYRVLWRVSEYKSNPYHGGVAHIRNSFLYFPYGEYALIGSYKTNKYSLLYLGVTGEEMGDIYRFESDGQCHKNAKLYNWVTTKWQNADKVILLNANVLSEYHNEYYFKTEFDINEYGRLEGGVYGY
ncbi:hypothetical protein DRO91_09115 [Candidatus Heimdallarchaeota archaeon]|nr:MAG: hypothetical protein DRO91_09115 [Candidatus Heimdallarchaeota archaeon]